MNTKQNESDEDDEIGQIVAMTTDTFDEDDVMADAAMQAFTSRATARRQKAMADYWAALEALALRDKLTGSEREQQFDKLDDIRLLLEKNEQDVRLDFEALREFIVAHDAAEQSAVIDEERQRRAASVSRLQNEIQEIQKQLDRKQREAADATERAGALGDFQRRVRTVRVERVHALKQRGLDSVEAMQRRLGSAPKSDRPSKWRWDQLRASMANAGLDLDSKTWKS